MDYQIALPPAARAGRFCRALGIAALVAISLALLACRGVDWFLLKRSLRSKFSAVDWITTRELAEWLADKSRPQPALLDVRTPAEWAVSHLPGARRVEPEADAETAAAGLPREAPIVTYCSVGYRSGRMAERLRAAGYRRVQNLEGSIFEWANEQRPLVRDGARATRVHPYDSVWGRLLKPALRAPLP